MYCHFIRVVNDNPEQDYGLLKKKHYYSELTAENKNMKPIVKPIIDVIYFIVLTLNLFLPLRTNFDPKNEPSVTLKISIADIT